MKIHLSNIGKVTKIVTAMLSLAGNTNLTDEEKVLRFLDSNKGGYNAKAVANKVRLPYKSVKTHLYRLGRKNKILRPQRGFYCSKLTEYERILEGRFTFEKGERPKLHDIHLMAKNIKKSNKRIPCLSGTVYVDFLFDTMNPDSIYQKWNSSNLKNVKGGLQEYFDYNENRVTIQLYATGTIVICLHNDLLHKPHLT